MTFPYRAAFLAAAATLASASAGSAAEADRYWVFFGTYTGGKSQGIYRSELDPKTGALSPPELAAEMASPSFLAIHPANKFLYAVGEGGEKDGGPVVAFALDAKACVLTKLNELRSGGAGPCHISIDQAGLVRSRRQLRRRKLRGFQAGRGRKARGPHLIRPAQGEQR